jgi:hypothetical protein
VLTTLALLLLQAPKGTADVDTRARAAIPFTYHERVAFVRAHANGSERLFLLDTGASKTALDAATARELALEIAGPVEVEGTTGVIQVESARLDSLAIGACAARDLVVTVQDLGGSLSPPDAHLDGILGSDFLAAFVLELDFGAKRLSLAQGPLEPPPPGALPLELDNRIPRFRAQLDDLETWLRLDTGASLFETQDIYVNVTESVWDELRRADPELAPERHFTGTGTGGTPVQLPVARIHALLAGEKTIERPYVIVQPRAGYFARPDAVGFVGNNFLEKFGRVTIDYPGRRLVLGASKDG